MTRSKLLTALLIIIALNTSPVIASMPYAVTNFRSCSGAGAVQISNQLNRPLSQIGQYCAIANEDACPDASTEGTCRPRLVSIDWGLSLALAALRSSCSLANIPNSALSLQDLQRELGQLGQDRERLFLLLDKYSQLNQSSSIYCEWQNELARHQGFQALLLSILNDKNVDLNKRIQLFGLAKHLGQFSESIRVSLQGDIDELLRQERSTMELDQVKMVIVQGHYVLGSGISHYVTLAERGVLKKGVPVWAQEALRVFSTLTFDQSARPVLQRLYRDIDHFDAMDNGTVLDYIVLNGTQGPNFNTAIERYFTNAISNQKPEWELRRLFTILGIHKLSADQANLIATKSFEYFQAKQGQSGLSIRQVNKMRRALAEELASRASLVSERRDIILPLLAWRNPSHTDDWKGQFEVYEALANSKDLRQKYIEPKIGQFLTNSLHYIRGRDRRELLEFTTQFSISGSELEQAIGLLSYENRMRVESGEHDHWVKIIQQSTLDQSRKDELIKRVKRS